MGQPTAQAKKVYSPSPIEGLNFSLISLYMEVEVRMQMVLMLRCVTTQNDGCEGDNKVNGATGPVLAEIYITHGNNLHELCQKFTGKQTKDTSVNAFFFLFHDKTCLSSDKNFKIICFKVCL